MAAEAFLKGLFFMVALAALAGEAASPPDDLAAILEPIRAKHGLPALAAAVLKDGKVAAIGAVGKRKAGGDDPVTVDDQWHLGSLTKAMTATLIARLVERGRLSWDLSLEKAFPGLKMDSAFKSVTLERLLTHTGGFPAEAPEQLWSELWRMKGTPSEQRMTLVRGILPGKYSSSGYLYSNVGYALAGAIAERTENKSWENLLEDEVFTPLRMNSSGFGAPAKGQPWGHVWRDGAAVPVEPGPNADNPPGIAPAGAVHATLRDWARFALLHLEGERRKEALLRPDSFKKLHTAPAGQEYASGWIVVNRRWAGGRALTHAGSNTMWYAVVWLAPEKGFGVLVATNLGGGPAGQACDEVAAALISRAGL